MQQLLLIAIRNLLQHRRRTLLLGGAIAGVTVFLVVVLALMAGIRARLLEAATTVAAGHVNVGGFYKFTPGSSAPVVTEYPGVIEVIKRSTPDLDYVTERGRGLAKLVSETGTLQMAITSLDINREPNFRRVVQVKEGRLEDLAAPNTILLFTEQAKRLNVGVGDVLTLTGLSLNGSHNTADVRVVAVAESMGLLSSMSVFIPNATLRELYNFNDRSIGVLMVYLRDHRQAEKMKPVLRRALEEAGYKVLDDDPRMYALKFENINREDWTGQKLDITTWEDELFFMRWILSTLDGLNGLLTFILLVIIAVGVMNTLWISIRERTREIGTLRAVGMQRGRVLGMFVIEAFVLGLSGTTVGALVGLGLCRAINLAEIQVGEALRVLLMRSTLILQVEPLAVLGAMALITLCTSLIALIPSFLAARLKPITAIHHVG